MRHYFASGEMWGEHIVAAGAKNALAVIWEIWDDPRVVEPLLSLPLDRLFIDSGAFSAKTRGVEIPIQKYISWLHAHKERIALYASLDVIGDPEKSKINQAIMEREGLTPLPCFHLGEPIRYLEEMVERYQYIAVGGYVGLSMHHAAELRKYLSQIFAITRDRVAVHGFGVGSLALLLRYPFFSTDSTSWYRIARFGFLLTFKHGRLG